MTDFSLKTPGTKFILGGTSLISMAIFLGAGFVPFILYVGIVLVSTGVFLYNKQLEKEDKEEG